MWKHVELRPGPVPGACSVPCEFPGPVQGVFRFDCSSYSCLSFPANPPAVRSSPRYLKSLCVRACVCECYITGSSSLSLSCLFTHRRQTGRNMMLLLNTHTHTLVLTGATSTLWCSHLPLLSSTSPVNQTCCPDSSVLVCRQNKSHLQKVRLN